MQAHTFITKDMNIGDAVAKYPAIADVFLSYGLHCVGCHVNAFESIEMGAMGHGMTPEEVEEMISEANAYLEEMQKPREGFTVTRKAIEKLKALSTEESKKGWGLRVEVVAGGCSGFRYNLDFDQNTKEGDTVFTEGYPIYIDSQSIEHVKGATLDYIDGLSGSGFKINNPNAKSHCGCGKSFQ